MKEYFILCLISILLVTLLDIRLKTNLYKNKKFWVFQLIVVALTTVVDNYSSGLPIVIFGENVLLNVRVGYVPVENYLFGYSLLTFNVILFEYFKRKENLRDK